MPPEEMPKGQQKLHTVHDSTGAPVTSPSGQAQWTQAEWKQRDKSLGYVRVDDDGTEIPEE